MCKKVAILAIKCLFYSSVVMATSRRPKKEIKLATIIKLHHWRMLARRDEPVDFNASLLSGKAREGSERR